MAIAAVALAGGCGTVSTATAVVGAAGSAVVTGATAVGSGAVAAGSAVLDVGGAVASLGVDAASAAVSAASAPASASVSGAPAAGASGSASAATDAAAAASRAGLSRPAAPGASGGVQVSTLSGRPVAPTQARPLSREASAETDGPEARRFRLIGDAAEAAKSCLSHPFDLDLAMSALEASGFEIAGRDEGGATARRGSVRVALSPSLGLCLVTSDALALSLARRAAGRALDEAFGADWTLLEVEPRPGACAPMRVATPAGDFELDFEAAPCVPAAPARLVITASEAA